VHIIFVFLLALLSYNAIATAEPQREVVAEVSQKYKDVLYPEGLPMLKDQMTGSDKRSIYKYCADGKVGKFGVVLYSEGIIGENGEDGYFSVYLALLEKGRLGWVRVNRIELTEFVPVFTEIAGNFLSMDGVVNNFSMLKNEEILHVNLWGVLSGSGAISGATDLFFRLKGTQLETVLILRDTSKSSRMGYAQSAILDSKIYVGEVEKRPSIVVQSERFEQVNIEQHRATPQVSLYEYSSGVYNLVKNPRLDELSKVIGRMTELPRSKSIPSVAGFKTK